MATTTETVRVALDTDPGEDVWYEVPDAEDWHHREQRVVPGHLWARYITARSELAILHEAITKLPRAPRATPGEYKRYLPGYVSGSLLLVPCLVCNVWHQHGIGDTKPGEWTHRVAHCREDTGSYHILVQQQPFQARWRTPTGRISRRLPDPLILPAPTAQTPGEAES